MEAALIATGLICLALGVAASIISRFTRPIRSVIPILAGIAPSVVMLGADRILDSEVLGWTFILSGGVLFLLSALALLSRPCSDGERHAGALSIFGLVVWVVWLLPFLSAISLGHV